jgi:glucose/mannose transport system substrate-binding protein
MNKLSLSLITLTVSLSMLLSACGNDQNGTNTVNGTNAPSATQNSTVDTLPVENGQVEIFSWWTGAGEEDGLKGLIQLFKDKYPNTEVINAAVSGGAGTNAKAVLASRMQGGDPPGTFQVHGGEELNSGWVAAGKMQTLNDLYQEEGWADKFPQDLIDMVSSNGDIWSVPVNIHRSNVLWFNKKVFEDNNLQVPATFDDFFSVAETLKAKGITPLALGDKEPWAATHLFESVLLGTLGPDGYKKLWSGDLGFDDAQVKQALETFKKMLSYTNDDHAARNWQDASQLVANGEAAMNVMGDWAKGYFSNDLKLETNVDFGYAASPNTNGSFIVVTDTFGLPKGIKDPESVKEFLKVLGSAEGQDIFNPLKGSIPARVDADLSKYDVYGKDTIEDFKNDSLAPSLAHGSAAPEGFVTQVNQVVNIFVTNGNVDQAVQALQAAADSN